MPLNVTVRLGEDFFVGHTRYFLKEICSDGRARITRSNDGVAFEVSDDQKTEVENDVLLQLGDRMTTKAVRLVIDAPRSKLILLGDKYRAAPPP